MIDIRALRSRTNALIERRNALRVLLDEIATFTVRFDQVLYNAATQHLIDDYDEDAELHAEFSAVIDSDVAFVSKPMAYAIHTCDVEARNFLSRFASLRLKAGNATLIPDAGEVNLAGLTDEIDWLQTAYQRRIAGHTEALRDAHTTLKYMIKSRQAIPDFARQKCLGFFGSADFAGYVYSASDFKPYNSEWVYDGPILPRTGMPQSRLVNHHPMVLSGRFLAAVTDAGMARRIEQIVNEMEQITRPLPGEPDSLDYFGSHVSNAIKVVV